jgi:hypothetical protein
MSVKENSSRITQKIINKLKKVFNIKRREYGYK